MNHNDTTDVASTTHQLASDCYPPTDSDDESFVVLERSVGPDHVETHEPLKVELLDSDVVDRSISNASEALASMGRYTSVPPAPKFEQLEYANSVASSTASALSVDEIQKKVDVLIDENNKLKDMLHQNNMALKNKYETLIDWSRDVERVGESHKKKFAETKQYIKELQTENAKLKSLLQAKDMSFVNVMSLKSCDSASAPKSDAGSDLSGSLKSAYESQIDSLTKQLQQVELKSDEAVVSITKTLRKELIEKEQQFDEKEQNYLEQITALKLTIEKMKERELLSAEKESAVGRNMIEASRRYNEQEMALRDELRKTAEAYQAKIDELNGTVEMLRARSYNDTEDVGKVKAQLMAAQVCITDVRQKLKACEADREAKCEDVRRLEAKIAEMSSNDDRNVALEQQLEIYKADFEAERESKKKAVVEKNDLAENLVQVQRQNEKLLKEIDSLKAKCTFVEVKTGGGGERSSSSSPSAPRNANYSCPRCNFGFYNYQALENHVYRCIELDSLP